MVFGPRPSPLLDGVSKFGPMQKAATDHIRARLQGTDTVTAVRYSRHSAKACAGVFPALSDWRNAPRKSARPAKREVCADGAQYPERAPSLAYRICISYAIYGITHCTLSPAMDGARDAGNIPSLAPELRPRRRHWELLLHPANLDERYPKHLLPLYSHYLSSDAFSSRASKSGRAKSLSLLGFGLRSRSTSRWTGREIFAECICSK